MLSSILSSCCTLTAEHPGIDEDDIPLPDPEELPREERKKPPHVRKYQENLPEARKQKDLKVTDLGIRILSARCHTGTQQPSSWKRAVGKSVYCLCEVPGKLKAVTKVLKNPSDLTWNFEGALEGDYESPDALRFAICAEEKEGAVATCTMPSNAFTPDGFSGTILLLGPESKESKSRLRIFLTV